MICVFCGFQIISKAQLADLLQDTLNKTLQKSFINQNVKGVTSAVFFPDGSVWESAQGNLGGSTNLTPNYLVEMGSNTKTFVAATILQLQEEGKLSLNDTIYQYIKKYKNVPSGITIRQLLNHTSGIYNYTNSATFASVVNTNFSYFFTVDSIMQFVEPPLFSAGANWSYSNTGYILLGLIIEAVEGIPFNEVLKNRFYTPLELKETFLDFYDTYTIPKAGSYLSNGTYFDIDFISFMTAAWSAGAIVSTPRDLAKWAFLLYNGHVLQTSSLDEMKQTVVVGSTNTLSGLGYFKKLYKGKIFHGHGGTTLQNSTMNYADALKYAIVCNVIEQNKSAQAANIENALIDVIEYMMPQFPYEPLDVAENNSINAFQIYPNPAGQFIYLKAPKNQSFVIYNMQGKLVKTIQTSDNIVDISNLSKGLYFVQSTNGETQKLIVQ